MFCSKCGKEIFDEAVVCPYCGCATNRQIPPQAVQPAPVQNYAQPTPANSGAETSGIATAALICAFLCPIVGLILGIIGTTKYKTESLKNKCIAAIPISIVVWIVSTIIIYSSMY